MSIIPQKHCPKCGRDLPHSAFHKNKRRHDGLASWCKSCFAALDKARNAVRHPKKERVKKERPQPGQKAAQRRMEQSVIREQLRATATKVCKRCGQEKPKQDYTEDDRYADGRYPWCADCRREWRQGRRDEQRELERKWREENLDHARAESRKWYHEHRDRELIKRRARLRWRWHFDPAYRAKKNAFKQQRYHNDPEYNRKMKLWSLAHVHRRRARIKGTNTRFTAAEWRALCEKYDCRCLRCGERKPLSPDHIVPISRGGANDIANIQPLCAECNSWKAAKTIDYRPEWGSD